MGGEARPAGCQDQVVKLPGRLAKSDVVGREVLVCFSICRLQAAGCKLRMVEDSRRCGGYSQTDGPGGGKSSKCTLCTWLCECEPEVACYARTVCSKWPPVSPLLSRSGTKHALFEYQF